MKHLLSHEALEDYRLFGDTIYVPIPGIFDINTKEGRYLMQMEANFAQRAIINLFKSWTELPE